MTVVKKIKSLLYNYSLTSKLKSIPISPRAMVSIQEAKQIGILYNATKPDDVMVISQFAEKIKTEGKVIHILGFKDEKSKEDDSPRVFNKNSVNWYGVPNDDKIDVFQKLDLDILISAFTEECLPLEYISATSKAKCRVGTYHSRKTKDYELMINIGNKNQLPYLIQQILHFLKEIKKDDK